MIIDIRENMNENYSHSQIRGVISNQTNGAKSEFCGVDV